MSFGIAEQAGLSVATTLTSYSLFACFKWLRKRKVFGCLLPKGKTYAQTNLVNERKLLFIDLDGMLSPTPLVSIEKSKLRLELYPKCSEIIDKLMKEHKNTRIVFCSNDYELLCHIGLKKKTFAFLPSKDMLSKMECKDKANVEKLTYQFQLELEKNKQVFYNDWSELSKKMYEKFM